MRVLIAPDSFKGSLTAREVADAIAAGWHRAAPDDDCVVVPLADGGDGTVSALVGAWDGELVTVEVTGPMGQSVAATYGLLTSGDGRRARAVIEMAAASGLGLQDVEELDPRHATTYGTGQLIRDALDGGVRHIVLGLGGSATIDAGTGMAVALGARLLDGAGRDLDPGGLALADLASVDVHDLHPAIPDTSFTVASDVDNPLTGPRGAAAVFGPQKGATEDMVADLDHALGHCARVLAASGLPADPTEPGGGAAGGLGLGARAFLGATMQSGIDLVMDEVGLADAMDGIDLVITGEGRIDGQTLSGKAPMGVLRLASDRGIPTIAIVGSIGDGAEAVLDAGMTAVFTSVPGPIDLATALANGAHHLERTSRTIASAWHAAIHGR